MQTEAGNKPLPAEHWTPVYEVTADLGAARYTIYQWIDATALTDHQVSRLWKFKRSEIDVWVRAGGADRK